jgi:hypothetical protein
MLEKINKRKIKQILHYGSFPSYVSFIFFLACFLGSVSIANIYLAAIFGALIFPVTALVGLVSGMVTAPPLNPIAPTEDQLALKSANLDDENALLDEEIYYLHKYENIHEIKSIERNFKDSSKATLILSVKIVNKIYGEKDDANTIDRHS